MAKGNAAALLSCVRAAARSIDTEQKPDRELLDAFLTSHDPQAFAALLRRHAPLVLSACRQVLREESDVEDAFQAAFLVLHQKAATIRQSQSVGSWLFCVARRVALAARRGGARRLVCELQAVPRGEQAPPDLSWAEVRDILHEEVERLPEHYRQPILLCYLNGQTRDEAARHLGWSSGTLIGRLERGRKMLRRRLVKRGVALSAGLLAILGDSASASVSPALVQATLRATRGEIRPAVAALIHGAAPMTIGKAKVMFGLILVAGLIAGFSGFAGAGRDTPAKPKAEAPDVKPAEPPAATAEDKEQRTYRGLVLDPAGKPVAGAAVSREGKEVTRTDASGRFEYKAVPPDRQSREMSPLVARAEGLAADWVALGDETNLTLRLKPIVPIRGTLVDLQGKPIVGAKLTLERVELEAKGGLATFTDTLRTDPSRATQVLDKHLWRPAWAGLPSILNSDEKGRFEISPAGWGSVVMLCVKAEGFEQVHIRVVADTDFDPKALPRPAREVPGMPRRAAPDVYGPTFTHSVRPTQPIVGTVRDAATGKPLAGVHVNGGVTEGWWENHATTQTDEQGRYRLDGLPKAKERRLMFSAAPSSGYLQAGTTVGDAEGLGPVTADINLIRGVRLTVKATDKATGKPISWAGLLYNPLSGNAAVAKMKGQNIDRYGSVGYRTNAEGKADIIVPPGLGIVTATLDDRRVSDASYTQAVMLEKDRKHAYSDPDGGLGEAVLGAGGQIITLLSRNAYAIIDPAADATTASVELQFDPGMDVTGRVVGPDGQPVTGATILGLRATWDQPVTLRGDTFTAKSLDGDRPRTVAVLHEGRKLAGTLSVRGKDKEVVVRLAPWATLTGRAVDEDGKPIAGALVRIYFYDRAASHLGQIRWPLNKPFRIGPDGRFRFEGILPGQTFGISLAREGQYLSTDESLRKLKVESGQVRDLGEVVGKPMQ